MRSHVAESHLEVARHTGALQELEPAWRGLVDPAHPGAAFRSFEWISTWWTSVSTSKESRVLVARRAGEVVGLLPMYVERTPLGTTRLRLMADGIVGSDWMGAIAQPQHLESVSLAFARELRGAELQLDDLAGDDPLLGALAGAVEPRFKCPYVRMEGTFADYLKKLPDGTGQQYHRRRKWLEKQPGYAIELHTTPADVERGMRALLELHRRRWALDGGSDAIDDPRIEAFHLETSRKLAEKGWARVWVMQVDGAPRAALYGWRLGNRVAYYQAGHDPEWRQRSVGTVLLGHIINGCFAEGVAEFDFLRGEEAYKWKWATGHRETVRLRARGTGLGPIVEEQLRHGWARLKETARAALPDAYERLLRLRKQLRGHA
jgi:CelD/BcsL family acetyltransferase involved in cellulose biosynthesis